MAGDPHIKINLFKWLMIVNLLNCPGNPISYTTENGSEFFSARH